MFVLFGVLVPYGGSVAIETLLTFLEMTGGGAVDIAGNILIVRLWGSDRGAGPAMNALHAAWGVGSAVAPLIASLFTASAVHQAYLAVGLFTLLTGLLPLTADVPMAPTVNGNQGTQTASSFPRARFCWGVCASFLFYFCYIGAEKIPADWGTTVAMSEPIWASENE